MSTVIIVSTPRVDGYCCFYPGCRQLLLFLPRVSTVIVVPTPGVDGYYCFYLGCQRLLLFLSRVSTVIVISILIDVDGYYCFYPGCRELLLLFLYRGVNVYYYFIIVISTPGVDRSITVISISISTVIYNIILFLFKNEIRLTNREL